MHRYPEGESYEDLIARVSPIVDEILSQKGYLIVVCHQAVGRIIYAKLVGIPDKDIPTLHMPLHTLFEFTPAADGKLEEKRTTVAIPSLRRQVTFEDKCIEAATIGMSSRMPEVVAEMTA
jgi:broad specificity phosphatase PhoE